LANAFHLAKGYWPARVVELVDALDSKSSARKGMSVRFRPRAPQFIQIRAEKSERSAR